MDVVDHEPAAWFLLADGEQMFLDVNCEAGGGVGYSILLELTADERRAIVLEGHVAADRLGLEVAASPRSFWDRQVIGRGDEVLEAVFRFRDSS